jgi:transposase InsO family protein
VATPERTIFAPRSTAGSFTEGFDTAGLKEAKALFEYSCLVRTTASGPPRLCTGAADQPTRLPDRAQPAGRNFVASRPGQVWLADLTYIPTGEGWFYLALVLDLHTRKFVGW